MAPQERTALDLGPDWRCGLVNSFLCGWGCLLCGTSISSFTTVQCSVQKRFAESDSYAACYRDYGGHVLLNLSPAFHRDLECVKNHIANLQKRKLLHLSATAGGYDDIPGWSVFHDIFHDDREALHAK